MKTLHLIWNPDRTLMKKYSCGSARAIPDSDIDEHIGALEWMCSDTSDDAQLAWPVCQEMFVDYVRASYAEGKIKVDQLVMIVNRGGFEHGYELGFGGKLTYSGEWPPELDLYSRILDRILDVKGN